ncbi:glutamine synthetase II [Nitzschia inconspicua]|uniref:Glutamine synthetase II n=1 Tax=Nitzschia inconspicua TaxID=303405 RepID=A0A9K3PAY1_9STRA|nr:glutamine synthetase II [Nitzschia inconspicua]
MGKFRLNAPQRESDVDMEVGSMAFGGIGDKIENPTNSTELDLHGSNKSNRTPETASNGPSNRYFDEQAGETPAGTSNTAGRLGIGPGESIMTTEKRNGDDDDVKEPKEAPSSEPSKRSMRMLIAIGVIAVLLLVALVVAVSVALTRDNGGNSTDSSNSGTGSESGSGGTGSDENGSGSGGSDPGPSPDTTLGRIYNEGVLRCGVPVEQPGFAFANNGRMEGFDADLCRAVAAGIFGPDDVDYRVEFVPVSGFDRWNNLKDGTYDVLARTTTHTMEREVLEPSSGSGFSFSIPYLYNGMQFAGIPSFVGCADNATVTGTCADLKICALDGTTHIDVILKLMPDATVAAVVNPEALYTGFISGTCNVIAAEQFDIAEVLVRDRGYSGDYSYGTLIHSKEPLCLVTRDDDPTFSDFVNWIMEALIAAEEAPITSERAQSMSSVTAFGQTFEGMARDAVEAVGNYGELYERNLESLLPRSAANTINDGGQGGLLYAFPFANLEGEGAGPVANGTLSKILERGFLKCGVSKRVIFAQENEGEWTGFDVDFCKALSAAIFNGVTDTIEYTDLSASERFVALAAGDVDVLSRLTTLTLERDVNEPGTGQGFHFAMPNFYDGMTFGGIPPYGACADSLVIIGSSCQNILICVNIGTTFETIAKEIFPERVIVSRDGDALGGLADGSCNVVAGGVTDVSTTSIRSAGYEGPYQTGSGRYSKDPLAMVTREDDIQWAKFVYWIVNAIFYAEEEEITQDTAAEEMPEVTLFGTRFQDMFKDAVSAVGNYGEIYERNAESEVSRGGLNTLNTFLETPQLYPLPGIL